MCCCHVFVNLAGTFPPVNASALTFLSYLSLSQANISGPLPPLRNMTNLKEVILDGNRFTGQLPSTIPDSLEKLELAGNKLTGTIPNMQTVSTVASALRVLDVSENDLVGTLPATLGWHPNILELRFRGNRLNGTLPLAVSSLAAPRLPLLFVSVVAMVSIQTV